MLHKDFQRCIVSWFWKLKILNHLLFLLRFFKIEVQLIYKVLLISSVQ